MNCKDLEELLSAYTDGELAGTQQDFLEEHLKNCPDCRALLADYTEVRRQISSLRRIPAVPDITMTTMSKIRTAGVPHSQQWWLRPASVCGRIIIVLATVFSLLFSVSFTSYSGLVSKAYAVTERLTSCRAISDKYTMLYLLAGLVQYSEFDYVVMIEAIQRKAIPRDIFARLFTRQVFQETGNTAAKL